MPSGERGAAPVGGLDDLGSGRVIPSEAIPRDSLITLTGPAAGAVSDLDDLLRWADIVYRQQHIGGVDIGEMTNIAAGGYGLGVAGVSETGTCIFDGCPPEARFPRLPRSPATPRGLRRVCGSTHRPTPSCSST